jgi:archaeosortase B (VPXXXP-CTERM-specific)
LQIITHLPSISEPITYFTTLITGSILKIFYSSVTINGFHIVSKSGIDMEIIYECTGIYGIIVYSSAILATWFPTYEKLKGIIIGVPIIYGANILRLVFLFVASLIYPPAFEFLHTYFWQLFLIIVVVLLFYFWFRSNLIKSKVIKDE